MFDMRAIPLLFPVLAAQVTAVFGVLCNGKSVPAHPGLQEPIPQPTPQILLLPLLLLPTVSGWLGGLCRGRPVLEPPSSGEPHLELPSCNELLRKQQERKEKRQVLLQAALRLLKRLVQMGLD